MRCTFRHSKTKFITVGIRNKFVKFNEVSLVKEINMHLNEIAISVQVVSHQTSTLISKLQLERKSKLIEIHSARRTGQSYCNICRRSRWVEILLQNVKLKSR